MRRPIVIIGVLSLVLSLFPAAIGAQSSVAQQCFPETGFCVEGRFLDYWNSHGGLRLNGYPLTGQFSETLDGKSYIVQYFERVRMEYHPENAPPNDVLLGQFGRALHPADPPVGPKGGHEFFPQTGHNVPPDFLAYWAVNGGLPQFGYPLSEVISEQLEDGKSYEVQYFERARFERHPENGPPYTILLGQFGRRILGGRVLQPLGSNFTVYNDQGGRYTLRRPADWTLQQNLPENNVIFRKPGVLWGAEVSLIGGWGGNPLEEADKTIGEQVSSRPEYVPLVYERITVGSNRGYRRVFQHRNDEGQTEIIIRIYFIQGDWLYNVNGFMLPPQRGTVEPLVDGLAGSISPK